MSEVMFRYEVPFGHRLMHHEGKCRFPHGHNYIFEVHVRGPVDNATGMVIDFSVLKNVVREFFDQFDHAFVLKEDDPLGEVFRRMRADENIHETQDGVPALPTKVVLLDRHPTAENLAQLTRDTLHDKYGLYTRVHCFEQRDCSAFSDGPLFNQAGPKIVEAW